MTIVSYAQNFEDVILWRALKRIERGFYIDIGAQDPVVDSVSCAFYEKGWRGVNVEPSPFYATKLREARPDEQVLEAAIGGAGDRMMFWEVPGTGLSTGDPAIAEKYRQEHRECEEIEVACMRLGSVLNQHKNREIHWLKIDVEGMERSVIQSWRPSRVRPWIVLVESTKPLSSEVNYSKWEASLLRFGYEFVYFDGLNRFYVSREHSELKSAFGPGANVFDDAVLSGLASAPFCNSVNARAAKLKNALAVRVGECSYLKQAFDTERIKVATLSDGLAKATSAWEQAGVAFAAEMASKNAMIAQYQKEVGRLHEDLATRDARIRDFEQHVKDLSEKNQKAVEQLHEDLITREARIRDFEQHVKDLSEKIVYLDEDVRARTAESVAKAGMLTAVYGSTSWRITAPIRFGGRVVRWFKYGSGAWIKFKPGSRPRRVARGLIVIFAKQRWMVAVGRLLLRPVPAFRERVSKVVRAEKLNKLDCSSGQLEYEESQAARLIPAVQINGSKRRSSPSVRRAYRDLKAGIERRR